MPHLWDNLVCAGFIQMNGPPAEFLGRFSPVDQGIIMIVLAGIFGVAGLGLLWIDKHPQPYSAHQLRFVK